MSRRKVRGRVKALPQAAKEKKEQHNERTNRKGKAWAKDHVKKDVFDLEAERAKRAERRKKKQIYPFLSPAEAEALERAIEEASQQEQTQEQ